MEAPALAEVKSQPVLNAPPVYAATPTPNTSSTAKLFKYVAKSSGLLSPTLVTVDSNLEKVGQNTIDSKGSKMSKEKEREKPWVHNFHLMCSKDNQYLPKYRREFFDNPLAYDVNGTRSYYASMLNTKNRPGYFPKGAKTMQTNSPSNVVAEKVVNLATKPKFGTKLPISELTTVEWSQIPNLREGREKSPTENNKERRWDNRCYRISTLNSVVHSHYRTLFEHIAKKN